MSVATRFVDLVDRDVAAALRVRGLAVFAPRSTWALLVLPLLVLVAPVAVLRGNAQAIYMGGWFALLLGFAGLWFYRFAKRQDVIMRAALEKESGNKNG